MSRSFRRERNQLMKTYLKMQRRDKKCYQDKRIGRSMRQVYDLFPLQTRNKGQIFILAKSE